LPPVDLRDAATQQYEKFVASFDWNNEGKLPVVLLIHGTSGPIAFKIVKNGFSALSTLDSGWYGSGIYFTSSALYALPYYSAKRQPSVIISLVFPGNPFPVTETRDSADTLLGQPIKSGYQSHFVRTAPDGSPILKMTDKKVYDEIVIGQESQVFPIFIIDFDVKKLFPHAQRFSRAVNDTLTDAVLEESEDSPISHAADRRSTASRDPSRSARRLSTDLGERASRAARRSFDGEATRSTVALVPLELKEKKELKLETNGHAEPLTDERVDDEDSTAVDE